MRASLRRMLRGFGVEAIDIAIDGIDAMQRCRDESYDIIICDYNLGQGKNGQQILEELRYTHSLKHASIYILVTAETTRSMVFGALESKPDDYLTKPFTQAVLQSRLDKILVEKAFFAEAFSAMDEGEFGKAAEILTDLAAKSKRYRMTALQMLGRALLKNGSYGRAYKLYMQIVKQREIEWAWLGCAQSLMGLGKWSATKKVLDNLLSGGSESLDVLDAMAETEMALGRTEEAQQILERAVKSSPKGLLRQIKLAEVAVVNRDVEVSERAYRKAIKLGENSCHDSSEHTFGLARCLLQKDNPLEETRNETLRECRALLLSAKKKYSTDSLLQMQAQLLEARTEFQANKHNTATEKCYSMLERYQELPETEAQLGLDMASALLELDDRVKAREVLENLAHQYENDSDVLMRIDALADEPISGKAKANAAKINSDGKTFFDNGDFEKAVAHFKKAVNRYPNNIAIRLNLILAMFKLAKSVNENEDILQNAKHELACIQHINHDHPGYKRYSSLCSEVAKLQQVA